MWSIISEHPNGDQSVTGPIQDRTSAKVNLLLMREMIPMSTHILNPPLPEDEPPLTPPEFMQHAIKTAAAQCQHIFGQPVEVSQSAIDLYTQIPIAPKSGDDAVVRLQSVTMDEIHTQLLVFKIEKLPRFLAALDKITSVFEGKVLTPPGSSDNQEGPSE